MDLEYLKSLSNQELIDLKQRTETEIDMYNTKQMTMKIMANSLYGALGNAHFSMYNKNIATAITGNSRFYINLMGFNLNKYLQELDNSNENFLLYIDTDSVTGDSKIVVDSKEISIEDFYNSIPDCFLINHKKSIKTLESFNYLTLSVSKTLRLEYKKINYIMKHKVSKKLYEIKCKNKSVKITEDHSIIVVREGCLVAVKPLDILKDDKLILSDMTMTTDFNVIDLGIIEDFVYDIEVNDNHNFFANNILVHNSNYFRLPDKFVERLPSDKNKAADIISDFIEAKIQPIINETSKELGQIYNALEADRISAKREAIADSAVFVAKKRYFMRVIDSEFVRYKEPKLKTMGIDIVRSSTPLFSRKYLKKAIPMILDSSEYELKQWIMEVREQFMKQNLMDIAKVSSVNSSKYKLGVDKSIPINSRAFLVSNNYIDNHCNGEISRLELGEKVKMLYLKEPNALNSNIFAFNNEKFANMFRDFIDWDTNFEKFFLKPLEGMVETLNYNLKQNTEELTEW